MSVVNEEQLGERKPYRRTQQRWPHAAKPCGRGYRREKCDEGQLVPKQGAERHPHQQRHRYADEHWAAAAIAAKNVTKGSWSPSRGPSAIRTSNATAMLKTAAPYRNGAERPVKSWSPFIQRFSGKPPAVPWTWCLARTSRTTSPTRYPTLSSNRSPPATTRQGLSGLYILHPNSYF